MSPTPTPLSIVPQGDVLVKCKTPVICTEMRVKTTCFGATQLYTILIRKLIRNCRQSCHVRSCVSPLSPTGSLQNASRPLSRGQPCGGPAYQMQTSGGFRLSSVLQKIEPGAPSGTPFAKCPIDVKCQEMWLFKIPGNKISTQQLSNVHAALSAKRKPSLSNPVTAPYTQALWASSEKYTRFNHVVTNGGIPSFSKTRCYSAVHTHHIFFIHLSVNGPSAGTTGACHHGQLSFVFLGEMGFYHVSETGLKLLTSNDPPASASQSASIPGGSHHACPDNYILMAGSAGGEKEVFFRENTWNTEKM
ncbi:hypothetical protein AAY473_000629 [Plecturocebus cupreus]